MAEYIEKESLIHWIEQQKRLSKFHTILIIQDIPAADVEKVVRCKDCFYNENGCCKHSENYDDTRYRPDYFCADGERRNDG